MPAKRISKKKTYPSRISNKLNKRIAVLIFLLLVLMVILIYLNYSYSFFFNNIGAHNLKSPYSKKEYIIAPKGDTRLVKYAALGDSLTAGVGSNNYQNTFGYKLSEKLASDSVVSFRNEGYPAAKVRDLLPIISEVNKFDPEIVTILIGINDVFNRTPIQEYRMDLNTIITSLKQNNRTIYLITIPYLGTSKSVSFPFNILYDLQLNRYNLVIRDVAQLHKLKLVDLYTLTHSQLTTDPTLYSEDLFHPSEKGYILISDLIFTEIQRGSTMSQKEINRFNTDATTDP